MASIGNYAAALAEAARNAARSSATGIGAAISGSARSEIPGINNAYAFAQSIRNSANSRAASSNQRSSSQSSASTNSSQGNANFNSAVVRELQMINANILEQTRLLRYQVDSNRSRSQFDEENAREQALRDSRLLDAINNIGSNFGGGPGGGGGNDNGGSGGGGILSRIGGMFGGGRGGGRPRSFGGKLLKGAGAVGLGAGALYVYGRMQNGENLSNIAKDIAPGLSGAALGGLVGSIAGPLGTAIGSMIGGALGDSDIGRKMFDAVLPKIQELGSAIGIDFDKIKNSFETVLLPKIKSSVENLTKIFNDTIIPNLKLVSNQLIDSFESIQGTFNTKIIPGLNRISNSADKLLDRALDKAVEGVSQVYSSGQGGTAGDAPLPTKDVPGPEVQKILEAKKNGLYPIGTNYEVLIRAARARDDANAKAARNTSEARQKVIEDIASENARKANAAGGRVITNVANVDIAAGSAGSGILGGSSKVSSSVGGEITDDLLDAVKYVESRGKANAINPKSGAMGAYQFMPGTVKWLASKGIVFDPFNEPQAREAARYLLQYLLDKNGGNLDKALAAYGGFVTKDPTDYINKIKSKMKSPPKSSGASSTIAPTGSGSKYPWESTAPSMLQNVTSSGASLLNDVSATVVSEVNRVREEIRNKTNPYLNAIVETAKNTKRTADAVAPRNKPIRPILKTPEQIIAETNKNFANQFQKIAPKAISLALRQTLFPKGIGVSQQAAGGALFRGQQLNNIFGVGRSVNKLATSLFGKQYGGMLAPALNNLATGYLEAGARAGGRLLFGMIGGMGAEQSNILTGQILGNYARGNKKLAVEQLLFGTTGVATGYETVFAKYGFKNPMQGIEYMANTLGAAGSDVVNSYMDPGAKASQWIDPRTGKKVGLNSTSSFTADAYGRIGDTSSTGATIQTVSGGDKAITTTDIESAKFAADQAYRDELIIAGIGDTNRILAEGRTGSGSTAGGSLGVGGGGGFFGAGGPLGRVGNMAFDLGKIALTQNIVKGLGVKNPYMQMLANFAVNQGLKYAGSAAYSAIFGNATFANALGQVAGGVSNVLGLGGGYSATATPAAIVNLTTSGAAASGSSMAGAAAMASSQGSGAAGTIGAAVPKTAGGGAAAGGAGLLDAAAALAMNPATWIVAGFLVVGSLIMGQGDDPNPTIQRILWNADNNDIAKITTNWTFDWGYLDQKGQVAWIAVCDQMLRIAFNAAKAFQVKAGSLGTNIGAFDYIGTQINKWGVIIAFYRGTPQAPLGSSIDQIDFGTPEQYSKLNANEVAARIVKKVEELYKKGVTYDAKLTEELGKTAESLQKVSYNTIAAGLLSATAGQLDTSISRVTYMQPVEAQGPYESNEAGPVGGSPRGVFNEKTGSWVTDAPDNVVGYDINGKPIYDLNSDRMLSAADFKTSLSDIQAIIPSATATNTGNFIAAASAAGALAGAATSGAAGSASGGSTVVAGNNNNNTTNNTTVVRQVSSVDVLRGMVPQTALPASG